MDRPLLLRNCRIADGSGRPAYPGDILILKDRIAALGRLGAGPDGALEIDLRGAVAAPGFIDAHAHDDAALLEPGALFPKLAQGVTTVVTGNCGIALPPLRLDRPPPPLDLLPAAAYRFSSAADYLAALGEARPAVNALPLAGHSALRVAHCADWRQAASSVELTAMRRALDAGLEAGLGGFSSGLAYPTALAATAEETAALAARALRRGRAFSLHIRNEYAGMWEALAEAFAIARSALDAKTSAAAPGSLVLSHQKCAGPGNRGRAGELLARLDAAARDLPLALDAYPYEAGSTVLDAESVRASRKVLIAWSVPHPELAGLELPEAAGRLGLAPADALDELKPAGAVYFHLDESDVEAILLHPRCMLGSDGLPHDRHPHPRLYGAFARFLGRFVRERRLLTLEEAVRKLSSLPAEAFGLEGRGRLVPGAFADLAAFDPAAIKDEASYAEPKRLASGVFLTLVNGEPAYRGPDLAAGLPDSGGAGAGRVLGGRK